MTMKVAAPCQSPPTPGETLSRLDALEARIAYQDAAVEDLNATITAQWVKIDRLVRQVEQLADQVKEAESRAASTAPVQPPPHY